MTTLNPVRIFELGILMIALGICLGVDTRAWGLLPLDLLPRGSIYTTIMELGPQNHNRDGLSVPNSIMVVCMDPLG